MELIGFAGHALSGKDEACAALRALGFNKFGGSRPIQFEVGNAFPVDAARLLNQGMRKTPVFSLSLLFCRDQGFVRWMLEQHPWWLAPFMAVVPRSGRTALQDWGAYRRSQNPDYWIRHWDNELMIEQIAAHGRHSRDRFCFSGVRKRNEIEWIRSRGGKVAWIDCTYVGPVNDNAIENEITALDCDFVIENPTKPQYRGAATRQSFHAAVRREVCHELGINNGRT